MATTTTISIETQIAAAKEVFMIEETGKTKTQIANEFGISTRSLNRYFDKHKSVFEIESQAEVVSLMEVFEPKESTATTDNNYEMIQKMDHYESLKVDQKVILAKYYENKPLNLPFEANPNKLGRTPKGMKSSTDAVLEIIESHFFNKTLTKENRESIAQEISDKIGQSLDRSKWLLSKYKKLFGASRLS